MLTILLILVLLAVIAGVACILLNNPSHQTRQIHKDAEKEVGTSSQKYYDNVQRTLRR